MLGKYEQIDEVKCMNNGEVETMWLLTGEGLADSGFEVDIDGDGCFNELDILERISSTRVSYLQDVISFAKEKHLESTVRYYNPDNQTLVVGGGKDCIIYDNLEFGWIEG
jgi:hypothetical protein